MAKKISQLTQATQVKSDDVTVIVQDGETKKLPLNMMVTKQDIENKKVAGLAKLDEIEATYENDTYTPTIAVKNKSSVKVGEGDGVDYSANVMDGHVKSAILKGQTFVNMLSISNISINNGTGREYKYNIIPTIGKNYLIKIKINSIGETSNANPVKIELFSSTNSNGYLNISSSEYVVGNEITKTITAIDGNRLQSNSIVIWCRDLTSGIFNADIIMIEYQEGMENWDIPYFEGMQSVKMPVLTTTGKNLFDINQTVDGYFGSNGNISQPDFNNKVSNYIKVKPNTVYIYSFDGFSNNDVGGIYWTGWFYYNSQKEIIGSRQANSGGNESNKKITFTTPSDCNYIRIGSRGLSLNGATVQLEEGSVATPYEPYKTNILTVNEDVELRGIGDVQDTLDCLTGEVTERVGEIVLNGSENWTLRKTSENTLVFNVEDLGLNSFTDFQSSTTKMMSDKFVTGYYENNDKEFICGKANGQGLLIGILKSKLATQDVKGLKQYLSQNPITVQYQLATESIKTVDLMPSGTHPSTTPYCWKNGHIQLSSSGLLPNLEYSVVTSRAGQINQNAAMIVKNDKRIFDLEILLAGGLVNTTYQALTLQNQVETGLSKVSLSSEKEPDYLLYHMIMKLIEEKAYKLDDLAEKVSVFYLYEKLSDEQFETIYAALYPFAEDEYFESDIPGDDEVIEEPIVDESLEEVEDEVVM